MLLPIFNALVFSLCKIQSIFLVKNIYHKTFFNTHVVHWIWKNTVSPLIYNFNISYKFYTILVVIALLWLIFWGNMVAGEDMIIKNN